MFGHEIDEENRDGMGEKLAKVNPRYVNRVRFSWTHSNSSTTVHTF